MAISISCFLRNIEQKGEMMDDTINRTEAIEIVNFECGEWHGLAQTIVNEIRKLPSAQPERILCKDCKHSEHWYRDKRRCFLWAEDGIDVFDDGFCNYAERR